MHNELVGVLIALNLIGVALCGLILAGMYNALMPGLAALSAGRAQPGDAVPQSLDLPHQLVATLQSLSLAGLPIQTRSRAAASRLDK